MEVSADLERNRQVALEQIEEASRKHKARLIVLPETALSGYGPFHWPAGLDGLDFKTLAKAEQDVQAAAKKFRIAVVIGTTTLDQGRFLNTALTFGSDGRRIARYDKMHLTGVVTRTLDAQYYAPGKKSRLKPVIIENIRAGVQICLDMRYPEPWRLLALAGVRLFLHPTAAFGRNQLWKREAVEGNLSSRCSENNCWMASANTAGPFQFVTSRIIDPDGLTVTAAQPDAEQVIAAAIDPEFHGRTSLINTRRIDSYQVRKS